MPGQGARKDTNGSLFGTNGVFNRQSGPMPPTTVQPYSKSASSKPDVQPYSQPEVKHARHSRHGTRLQEAAQTVEPPKPVVKILLVPVVQDNGHGMPVTVYKKYHYSE